MRAERKCEGGREGGGGLRGGGASGVTEILKDERGDGEIISHCKLREKDAQWYSSLGASTEQPHSSPARLELSHRLLLTSPFFFLSAPA